MKLYKLIRKPPFFLQAKHYIRKDESPMTSAPNARRAVIIPTLLIQYGSLRDKFKSLPLVGKAFKRSFIELYKSASQLKQNPHLGKTQIDPKTLLELEAYARELGISKIGYTKVNRDFIFKGFEILYPNAMVLGMEMDKDKMKTNPSDASTTEIWKAYSNLGIAVNKLAKWLRDKGYNCHPSPAIGGDVMITPVAQDAHLGYVGKNGLLITEEFGPSLRLAAVFCDIENLPLTEPEENPHKWIREFCDECNNCVHKCPGDAIFEETKTLEDGYPQFIDREKCAPHFSKNCSQCISSCPFIHGHYNKIKETFERHHETESA
ncbi:epoxyqueuosine reductase [Phaeocystidibacter luteus]|uniref:Epoxyqueuosine reductase n=1 Tax=Phaeocystidibacter luteus TaxID=911197 RepID=A0A6N6RGE4_9FLAO|nr:epoxyqueuosine reductase [Phaeocystidibacter luteus]KAB2807710.1 epoxyqueuosine reductase [Phaeocystidibacter luteus]